MTQASDQTKTLNGLTSLLANLQAARSAAQTHSKGGRSVARARILNDQIAVLQQRVRKLRNGIRRGARGKRQDRDNTAIALKIVTCLNKGKGMQFSFNELRDFITVDDAIECRLANTVAAALGYAEPLEASLELMTVGGLDKFKAQLKRDNS